MARRRLNRKVALIGTAVFVALGLLAVVVLLSGTHDPAQLIADGDAAFAARQYESARDNYAKAFEASDSLGQKIDLLFKLSDVYQALGDWRRVLACWEQVIVSDPKNLPARLGRLKHAYILADSLSEFGRDVDRYWKDVSDQATQLIGQAGDEGWLAQDKTAWEPSFGVAEPPGWDSGINAIGPYLYFLKGRAAYELARMGAVTAPERSLEEAKTDLDRSRQLDPNHAAVYRYLAAVYLETAQIAASRANLDGRQTAIQAAEAVLAEGVAATPEAPGAHINVLARKLTLAQDGSLAEARARMKALEPEYQALTERFPGSAEAQGALAEFYSYCAASVRFEDGREPLDRAIAAAQKAAALDPATVKYARFAATLHYRRSSLCGDQAALRKAIDLAEATLARPEIQDTPGPRHYAVLAERLSLCSLLATCCVERVLALPQSASERADFLVKAEGAVHEIGQIQGTADNPQAVKWQGMLELARDNTDSAIRSLYAAYEQIGATSATDEVDALLSYTLGKAFEDTSEVGAAIEFFESALRAGIATARPEALLDYGRTLLRAGLYDAALNAVNSFDDRFGATTRSRQLRVRTLIANGHLTEAEENLAGLDPADPNTMRVHLSLLGAQAVQLQEAIQRAGSRAPSADGADQSVAAMKAELLGYRKRQAQLAGQLWQREVDVSQQEHLALLCETLIEGRQIALARDIVKTFLTRLPNSPVALFYQELLSEPDPGACSSSRRQELRLQAIGHIADSAARAMALAGFYQENDRLDEAIAEWRKVLDATTSAQGQGEAVFLDSKQLSPRQAAAGRLFDVACYREDWPLAEEVVKQARTDNLDGCAGHLFAGRLAFARGRQTEALAELDECLRRRPVFSYGYMLRGNIHAQAGNERAAIEDARTASNLNPIDPVIAKALTNALLVRNHRQGAGVSEAQSLEAKRALEHAIRLNPRDTQVLMAYADLIGDSEPLKALAIRQTIQANAPTLANAVMLGRLATGAALKETDDARRQALFAMAETAFEQGRRMEPSNALLLESYAEYYRARGQNDKARQLLVESQDGRLLWRHYFRLGRYEEARQLLEPMLDDPALRTDALKGLVLIAEATRDRQAVKTYAEQLLALEDTVTNRLAQIRAYLDAGLVQDAKHRLQSLKERYPDDAHLGLLEALLAKRQGQVKRALELANRNLETNQQDALAWRLRGEICVLTGAFDQAVTNFTKSRALEDDPATTVALAKAYLWAGRDDEAVNELKAALEAPAVPGEAFTLLESIYRRLGREESLRQFYADTLARLPGSIPWRLRAGAFAIEQRDFGRARELYEKAYRLRQEQLAAVPGGARDAQYGAALDGYLHALILSAAAPDGASRSESLDQIQQEGARHLETPYAAVALCRMAEAKKAQGDAEAARDYCRKAIDRVYDDEMLAAEVLSRVCSMWSAEEVSNYWRQRLEADPSALTANLMMSHLARVREDYGDSVDCMDRCIALCVPQSQDQSAYLQRKGDLLVAAYRRTSDKQYLRWAIDVYESLATRMPTNSSVLNNLAYLLAQDDRDLDRALEYAGKVLAVDPDNAIYLDTYAYVLHKNGRNVEADEAIVAAVQQYELVGTPPAAVYEHWGMIREALGEKDKALAAYRQALQVAGETASDAVRERIRLAVERLP
ncbi:MAG: hypothetical protein JW993_13510 [Sedimentisphaerales bacterium]|nr:hypothetical protein [Sedimentisphaerales bacterium]